MRLWVHFATFSGPLFKTQQNGLRDQPTRADVRAHGDSQCPSASLSLSLCVCMSFVRPMRDSVSSQTITLPPPSPPPVFGGSGDGCAIASAEVGAADVKAGRALMCEAHLPTSFHAPAHNAGHYFQSWRNSLVLKSSPLMFVMSQSLQGATAGSPTSDLARSAPPPHLESPLSYVYNYFILSSRFVC